MNVCWYPPTNPWLSNLTNEPTYSLDPVSTLVCSLFCNGLHILCLILNHRPSMVLEYSLVCLQLPWPSLISDSVVEGRQPGVSWINYDNCSWIILYKTGVLQRHLIVLQLNDKQYSIFPVTCNQPEVCMLLMKICLNMLEIEWRK